MYKNLEAEMKRKNITQKELAKMLEITQSTLSLKLSGKSDISVRVAKKIRKILEVEHLELDFLFDDGGNLF